MVLEKGSATTIVTMMSTFLMYPWLYSKKLHL